jgi:TRAP-type C4-dicarboxylate transport system permease small subunit
MSFKIFLSKFLKYGTLLTSLGFVMTVSLQIFARFFLSDVPPWTEEASRILFIYAIAFSSGLAYRGNYFVFLEAFYASFSDILKKKIDLISPILSLVLFGFCGFYSLSMLEMGLNEYSPTLHILMIIPFLSIFILSLSISYYSLMAFLKKIKFWKS